MANEARRTVPLWTDSMSDGCSHVEDIARPCCVKHDEAYYYGGSKETREYADRNFYLCMIENGISTWRAYVRFLGVRLFGGPGWKTKGESWSFGGNHFQYSDEPAIPTDEK